MVTSAPKTALQEECLVTMNSLDSARQMPGYFYTDPGIFNREKELIFKKTWICIGREEQVTNNGDYMAIEVVDESIAVVRDKFGKINCFVNMCLHRGVPVVYGKGNTKGFSCPYHAWHYDLNGALTASPYMEKSKIEIKGSKLKQLRVALWEGWIFTSFNSDVESFDSFIGPIAKDLVWFKSGECKLAERVILKIDCNWKLLLENLIDIYHVPVLHKASFGGFLKTDRNTINFNLLDKGCWHYEQEARPHAKGGRQLFPTLPWLEGLSPSTSMKAGIFPNINLSLRFDSLRLWQVLPITECKSELHMYSLFKPAAFKQPDFQKNYEEYKEFLLSAIVEEDGPMVVKLQQAMNSKFYKPGPFSHMEGAVHHIIRYYLKTMLNLSESENINALGDFS